MQKPSIPKGMRDFSSSQVAQRDYIFSTISGVFRLFGYSPIETPSMENLSTLMGKYGEEGDRLLFKVLNSGDYGLGLDDKELRTAARICEKGLRYDLTVPFARYVVQHRNDIVFPFRRYQIAPVWRADRPQKGRYREFVQCDVDVIGTKSLLCELELIQIVERVFASLGLDVVLKINNRKILASIANAIGHPDSLIDIAVAIDKLDKISIDGVFGELLERGIAQSGIDKLRPILEFRGNNGSKLELIETIVGQCDGIDELRTLLQYADQLGVGLNIEVDLSLARGLNYYTGAIFEVKSTEASIGSLCGGGRYDDLTGIFGLPNTSGVGISFGAERIFDVLVERDAFPSTISSNVKAMFVNFGSQDELESLRLLHSLRQGGISAQIYPTFDKLKKQFDYAESMSVEYMIFIGETERASRVATVKNIRNSTQHSVPFTDLVSFLA